MSDPELDPVPAAPAVAPVAPAERVAAVDVLRGVAVLGVLPMNLPVFALPEAASNPAVCGGFAGADFAAWLVGALFFDGKMITLLSLLFGAGLVLRDGRRGDAEGWSEVWLHYRRMGALLAIGLAHAYLLWEGDILVTYALCGALAFPARRLRPGLLVALGLLVMLPALPLTGAFGGALAFCRAGSERAAAAQARGEAPDPLDRQLADAWAEVGRDLRPTPEQLAQAIEERRAESYRGRLPKRAEAALAVELVFVPLMLLWLVTGRMLLGMALMRLGVFAGTRPARFYGVVALLGYGVGLTVVGLNAARQVATGFDFVELMVYGMNLNYLASIPVALGHAAAVVLVLKAGRLTWLTDRLAAVGRMALTNYLTHSVVCTAVFAGYGLGQFGALGRAELFGFAAAVWAAQLALSPVWLRYFRFGPAEWLWRTLSYARLQPLRAR